MKLKVVMNYEPKIYTVTADRMQLGQMGVLRDNSARTRQYIGEIVLRTYYGLVVLSNPEASWAADVPVEVELLPPGTLVTITAP